MLLYSIWLEIMSDKYIIVNIQILELCLNAYLSLLISN